MLCSINRSIVGGPTETGYEDAYGCDFYSRPRRSGVRAEASKEVQSEHWPIFGIAYCFYTASHYHMPFLRYSKLRSSAIKFEFKN